MHNAGSDGTFRPVVFPEPDGGRGIVAVTEDISVDSLYSAYLQGVFPWFCEDRGEPVVWWSPDPRFVLLPGELHVPDRLERFLKRTPYRYTFDVDFEAVITGCANVRRPGQAGTWIGPKIIDAYCRLHREGIAHSVEVWRGDTLAGGLYGVLIGRVFCGESMFSLESDSAKSAFVLFVRAFASCGGALIDSQVYTDNLARFGAKNVSRAAFLRLERELLPQPLTEDPAEAFYRACRGTD
ncbi:leucyl/phenylalanyl-tRNA--protein transferase [Treponema brennaborense]|uniref:Leucyl/phenylalanyl-tRNA--protein transferase n=1 Tax=Treponema brennaborense (strain DSM 12168 / CIP 105900 / DD5/3) TaxID=906968 RepID=F4LP76_TREBD|nr:leucyl/phenylalanyl-tRNA--protein transferase [Treponema brennaborense]AEE15952.1 Leucyl/phenylalanyl-tRNA--protein transferase [Treponema brennaborense DSM 12168]